MLVLSYDPIISCSIVAPCPDNVSDHLPLITEFVITIQQVQSCIPDPCPSAPKLPHSPSVCEAYKAALLPRIEGLTYLLNDLTSPEQAQSAVDDLLGQVNSAISCAVRAVSHHDAPRAFKPKAYWCPELSQLRNRKRLWWRIWAEAGKPRAGAVYESYKGIKKLFRRVSRRRMTRFIQDKFAKVNQLFNRGRLREFWRRCRKPRKDTPSTLRAEDLAAHYETVMTEQGQLSAEQCSIAHQVERRAQQLRGHLQPSRVTVEEVAQRVARLKTGCAPGIDAITAEHLRHGNSTFLCRILADMLSCCLSWGIVPTCFTLGLIVPILKKPTSNPNDVNSYRPVTLSSVYSKLLEGLMLPPDTVNDSQFGFRKGRGTSMACSLYNDIKAYFDFKKSPLYTCSLDAEKCFDSIWHSALFYKLIDVLPDHHWSTLHFWYSNLKSLVRWNNVYSKTFCVTRGTRQGSILSPALFNVFINDLLVLLENCTDGVRIGHLLFNSFAYADDVTVFAATVPGLQRLIDMCVLYASRWKFNFGFAKTQCIYDVWQANLCE